ncbi:DUF3108 domain-containing protein [Apibacter sp. HY039]|uniref:DUF3108 domain-containing protein n=1 Tax=Apibacter sp. HY039 TaxID=2501476 RepID=UPI000FEBE718|nr:DUF3108 domain-containing protein [Apibacter sp. HY039]
MKKKLSVFLVVIVSFFYISADSVSNSSQFKDGEYLRYRLHYGLLNAGYATLTTSETTFNGKPHYHVIGEGYSTGAVKVFFKVEDRYETYMDKSNLLSSKFIRKIKEGSYVRDQTMVIDHKNKKLTYTDNRNNTSKNYNFTGQIHDMLSAFYYLRNMDTDNYKTGDFITLDIFLDNEVLNFKLKILGRENMKTSFGTVKCLKIRPYVLSGRVFKEKESVTMWVTDDSNHVPVQIKAELAVGSLKADLSSYKNLQNPINFTKK